MPRFKNRIQHIVSEVSHEVTHKHVFEVRRVSPRMAHSWGRFFRENTPTVVIGGLFLLSLVFSSSLGNYGHFLRTSLIGEEDIPFTGTVMPVEYVPEWTALSTAERDYTYDQIPQNKLIPIPDYDISSMQAGMQWDTGNETQRNTYVTYPVPHLGNYNLDATEYSGSHPGIDIKLPIGTPIRSIANGVVTKVKNVSYGGGQYIVISHPNVPSLENPNETTTIFSSYLHLSEQLVSEGERVDKGQIIGKSGNTGMSTAPHLHFQIDNEEAPFNPYWPFTQDEIRVAGYNSSFDAVRSGFAQDRAQMYIIHPVEYVARYETYVTSGGLIASTSNAVAIDTVTDTTPEPETETMTQSLSGGLLSSAYTIETTDTDTTSIDEVVEEVPDNTSATEDDVYSEEVKTQPEEKAVVEESIVEEKQPEETFVLEDPVVQTPDYYSLEFVMDGAYKPNVPNEIRVKIANSDDLEDNILLASTLKSNAEISPSVLTKYDFVGGIARVDVTPNAEVDFRLIAQSDATGEVKSELLKPQSFTDVSANHFASSAIKSLVNQKVLKGYDDGTFRPDVTLNRVESLAMILRMNAMNTKDGTLPFSDTDSTAWYAGYIASAVEMGIVKGNPDGTFRPGAEVSRAAFLAMVLRANGPELPQATKDVAQDIPVDAWFADYFSFAYEQDLLPDYWTSFRTWNPAAPVTRAEAAYILDKLSDKNFL